MPALAPTSVKPVYGNITITGAAAATLIFDGFTPGGDLTYWNVEVENLDPDAGDTLYVGFDSAVDANTGFQLGIFSDTAQAHRIKLTLPPTGVIYANCTSAETRDVRIIATPRP